MSIMENAAVLGIGITAILIAAVIGILVNTVILWLVTRFMLSVPEVTFGRCFKTALAMIVVTILMLLLLIPMAFLPIIGPVIWFFLLLKALKATIEGVLEINEGGWTILLIYILVQAGLNWMIHQAVI
jgi:hypothetical protein